MAREKLVAANWKMHKTIGETKDFAEKLRSVGEDTDLDRHFRSTPPEVPAAVIAWLASDAEAPSLSGQTLNALPFYKKRGLGDLSA